MSSKPHINPAPFALPFESQEALDRALSEPPPALIEAMARLDGDILILGVGGKMGPTLAWQAVRAVEASGAERRVIGVSGFSAPGLRERLESLGVETVQTDLLAPGALDTLPDARNVVYMAGRKFGSTGAEWQTWATNVYLAGLVGRRYHDARVVAFSSGNIYPFVPVHSGGAVEDTVPGPVGEYAMTCLGRERMFDYAARELGAEVLHFRLNYAVELRYGVLVDLASQVWNGQPVDVSMGHVNVVWQGYANAVALQCFDLAATPAATLNVTGPETVSVRWLARRLGEWMGKPVECVGEESSTALLSNASRCHRLFGYPGVPLDTLIEWTAQWIMRQGETLGKPTHFQTRDGNY